MHPHVYQSVSDILILIHCPARRRNMRTSDGLGSNLVRRMIESTVCLRGRVQGKYEILIEGHVLVLHNPA